MKGLLALSLLASGVAYAQTLPVTSMENSELCVQFATTMITGRATNEATPKELENELRARGETCAPSETYMLAASQRLQLAQQAQSQQWQQQMAAEQEAQERTARRREAFRQLGDHLLNQPGAPPAPTRTTCRPDGIGGVTCTSW
jgi:hypothetical protein